MRLFSTLRSLALMAALGVLLPAGAQARDFDRGRDFHGGDFHGGRFFHGRFYGYGYPYYYGPGFGFYYGGPDYYYGPGYYGQRYGYDEGAPGDLAVDVQRSLKRRGYYSGPIDGEIGEGSRNAIRNFQSEHHLDVTGRIDHQTLHALGI